MSRLCFSSFTLAAVQANFLSGQSRFLYDIVGKKLPEKNCWLIVKLEISVDPNILLLLKRSVLLKNVTTTNTCILQIALQLLKVTENNCYFLVCDKTSVFQHHQFVFEISTHRIWRHLNVLRSVWLWIQMLQQNGVQLCRTGLSGTNQNNWTRSTTCFSHHSCHPPASSGPCFPAILVPLPNLDRNAMQRLKKKKGMFFSGCGEIFETILTSIYVITQIFDITSKQMFSQAGIPGPIEKERSLSVPGTKCLQISGNTLHVAYCTFRCFSI